MFENHAIYPGSELSLIKTFMRQEGFEEVHWLLGTGLKESAMDQKDTLVSLHQFDIIYRNIYRLLQAADVGFRFGQCLNLSRWGVLSLALMSASSLGRALEIANSHRVLVRSRFNLSHCVEGEYVKIVVSQVSTLPFPVNITFGFEMLIASLQRQISDLIHRGFAFSKITLKYAKPIHYRTYSEHCACPIEFDAQENTLWVPIKTLMEPLMLSNQMVEKQAIAICEEEMARVEQVQKGDIAWLVKTEFTQCDVSKTNLEALSARLGMNARTLRRKLQLADTSYRELYQQYQFQVVVQSLADHQLDLATIAKQSGFSDAAGLRQAFVRWTGMSPSQYRRSLM